MIRILKSAALALLFSATPALAQPVLSNGGFEQNPPNNYGNNISWPIAPWVLMSGATNVVTVDGPGGQTWYGNAAPASDATGGTGNQHYFDQAGVAGTIYQEFTPLCTGEVRYGAYFSGRAGRGGFGAVTLKDATGANIIAGPASVAVPAGDSENDPWQLAAFTATLTAGTTYRFEVDMDNQLNMDNAYVAFGPECTEHSSPDWSDLDVETDPEPDPDPVPVQCTPFTQTDATCDATTGEITVTLNNTLTGTFDPNDLGVECLTPGVTVVQNPFNPLELIISGASAGQTVLIATNAVQDGAGNGTGLDLCCTGEVEIRIPEEMLCEAPVDVSIDKMWRDVILHEDQSIPPHGFEITVDLQTGSLAPGDVITVDDPASGQINVTAFGSPVAPAGWTCSISAGSWSCQYVVPPSGAILPATIIYPSIIDGSQHVRNCASVSVVTADGTNPDMNSSNNSGCWETNTPNPDVPTIELVKTGPAICDIDEPCDFTVTFTNTGSEAFTGNVLMQDQTTVSGFDVTNVTPMPAGCGGNLPANPFACVIALNNFAPGASQTYTITMAPNFPGGQVVADSGENCADVVSVPDSFIPGGYSWNYDQDGEEAMPSGYASLLEFGQPVAQSCVQYATEDTSDEIGVLTVEKTCERQPSMGNSVAFVCQITVSSTGPVTGTIDLSDNFGYQGFNGDPNGLVGQLTSADPWSCATAPYSATNPPECSISGADLNAAGGTSTLSVAVITQAQDLGETNIRNCAQIVNDAAEPEPSCDMLSQSTSEETGLTIVKACSPMPINGETTIPCSITVTGTGPEDGGIIIYDEYTNPNFNGDTNGQIGQITGPSEWTCQSAPYGNGVWPSCSISSADFAAMGGTATFMTSVTVSPEDMGAGVQNCAIIGVADTELDESCVDISANNPVTDTTTDTGAFELVKTCEPLVLQPDDFEMTMDCSISITPQASFEGTITINDVPTMLSGIGGMSQNPPPGLSYDASVWNCTTSYGATCTADGASYPVDGNGMPQTTTINITLSIFNVGGVVTLQNCAEGSFAPTAGEGVEMDDSCVTETYDMTACVPVPEIAGDMIDNDCDGDVDEVDQTGNNDGDETPEFNVFKSCDNTFTPVAGTDALSVNCTVQVTPLTPFTGTLTINDSATNTAGGGQGSFTSITGHDTNVWSCSNTNAAGFNCAASGANYPVDGNGWPVTTTFNTVLTVDNTGAGTGGSVNWNNCASGSYQFNTGLIDDVSGFCDQVVYDNPACTPVPEIPGDQIDNDCDGEVDETTTMRQSTDTVPELALTKLPLGDCSVNEPAQTYSCDFALTVENTGADPFAGPLHLLDAFGSPSPRNIAGVSGEGWQCLTASGADEVSCLAPDMPLDAGESTTVEMSLTLPGVRNGATFENCVSFALPENSVLQAKIVQTLLNDRGIDVGSVDGAVGPNTRAGIAELQRRENLPETGEVSDELLQALGLTLPAGDQTCVSVTLPPMPEPPLTCDPSTTVLIDGACECRFSRMMQSSASSCACVQGTQLDAGRGCFRPERQVSEPRRPSAPSSTPSTPSCPAGATYSAARGGCIAPPAAPQTCSIANQVMVNGRCRCASGYELRSGSCRKERRSSGGAAGLP